MQFLEQLARFVPEDERVLISSVSGDPDSAGGEMWNVRTWRRNQEILSTMNNYVCVSSFKASEDGRWRRTANTFGHALAFMVDDVGTKVAREALLDARAALREDRSPRTLAALPPTYIIETSPRNEQWWYFLSPPIADYDLFSRLQSAFIQQRAGGRDPGMAGANRVGRLPLGINGKAKYTHDGVRFKCRQVMFNDVRYSVADLVAAFGLVLDQPRVRQTPSTIPEERRLALAADFEDIKRDLIRFNHIIKERANYAGRIPILCPWFTQHTGQARTGTYLVEPNERNNWAGSFVCYHSSTHNNNNHLRDIRTWAYEMCAAADAFQCNRANAAAPAFSDLFGEKSD